MTFQKAIFLILFFSVCGIYGEVPTGSDSELLEYKTGNVNQELDQATQNTLDDLHMSEGADSFELVLQSGQSDYANCRGTYKKAKVGEIRGKSVYFNNARNRVIFYIGSKWVITSQNYLQIILDGGTGGFYASRNAKCTPDASDWLARYKVRI